MELTQAQISEIVYEKASSEQGLHELITLLLNSLLKHERTLWQEENKKSRPFRDDFFVSSTLALLAPPHLIL